MTIETLERYYGLAANIEAIEREIQLLYSPIRSPLGNGSQSSEPGNPTERTAMRIISLKDKLESERKQMLELIEEIEGWLLTCRDTEVVSIIRWHYILRLNWKQTNIKVYGYPDYNYSRQKVIRYFQKIVRNEEKKCDLI